MASVLVLALTVVLACQTSIYDMLIVNYHINFKYRMSAAVNIFTMRRLTIFPRAHLKRQNCACVTSAAAAILSFNFALFLFHIFPHFLAASFIYCIVL